MGKLIALIIFSLIITFWHDGFMYGPNWERLVETCHRHKYLSEQLGGEHITSVDYRECVDYIETYNNRWLKW